MRTTFSIDAGIFSRLKEEAARRGETMSAIVEHALRAFFRGRAPGKQALPPLPSFDGGRCLVDVADRDALYRAMEER